MKDSITVDVVLENGKIFKDLQYKGTAKELDEKICTSGHENIVFIDPKDESYCPYISIPADEISSIGYDEDDLPSDIENEHIKNILASINTMDFFNEDEDGKSNDEAISALEALDETERAILIMFYLGGESDKEIAEALDLEEEEVTDIRRRASKEIFEAANVTEGPSFEEKDALFDDKDIGEVVKETEKIVLNLITAFWADKASEDLKATAKWIAPPAASFAEKQRQYDNLWGIDMQLIEYLKKAAYMIAQNKNVFTELKDRHIDNRTSEGFDEIEKVIAKNYMSMYRTDIM